MFKMFKRFKMLNFENVENVEIFEKVENVKINPSSVTKNSILTRYLDNLPWNAFYLL